MCIKIKRIISNTKAKLGDFKFQVRSRYCSSPFDLDFTGYGNKHKTPEQIAKEFEKSVEDKELQTNLDSLEIEEVLTEQNRLFTNITAYLSLDDNGEIEPEFTRFEVKGEGSKVRKHDDLRQAVASHLLFFKNNKDKLKALYKKELKAVARATLKAAISEQAGFLDRAKRRLAVLKKIKMKG